VGGNRLGLVGLPAKHLAAITGVVDQQFPAGTEDGEAASVGVIGYAPRLGRERSRPTLLATHPVPNHNLLSLHQGIVACVEGSGRLPIGREGRIDDTVP
jgi:hypothetical protein